MNYHRVKKTRNILHKMTRTKASTSGPILRRKCLLKQVIQGNIKGMIEVTGRRKQPLDDLNDTTGYWKLEENAPDRTLWWTRFGSGYVPDL
jgi:hypothetical protein